MQSQSTKFSAAIMQPYLFPYVGYFHLIEASDKFVFYDDVSYINKGWINRNTVLHSGATKTFTVPLNKASQNKNINQIFCSIDEKWIRKFFGQLRHSYSKSPFYEQVVEVLKQTLVPTSSQISELAISSVKSVYEYLEIDIEYLRSSELDFECTSDNAADRLIGISKNLDCQSYVNASGGQNLYSKEYFSNAGMTLNFISSLPVQYQQFDSIFIPNLSIIDVLMFNSPQKIKYLFAQFEVI